MKFGNGNSRAAKLTPEIVNDIRRKYASGRWTQGKLARETQVTVAQIGRIVRFEAWQDLPPPLPSPEELEMQKRRLLGLQRALAGDVPPPPQAENLLDELKENDTEATPPES